ncbi:MAG: TetR/AcrR family transcriptional regulator [Polyangiaceae bacterium]|nr:TetR/AcrR family transcriptional regulator [Myxococcales bacterium]MCB9584495.1 TetR/AcrR family transcriptional regulator [Polyangiaceae bacterium]MCB9609338.1 TetR/AcrR family transcriptional regulator [Polyangiaceae bacterium]
MARSIPSDRFPQLIEAATAVFIQRGFARTQMEDVAKRLGVAKGTLYGYVESKEALFDAAVRFADGHLQLPTPDALPLRTPLAGATVGYVQTRVMTEAAALKLAGVMQGSLRVRGVERELSEVLTDLYEAIARNRRALKLIDRCAIDFPELAEVWFGGGRRAQVQLLTELLSRRGRRLRKLGSAEVVARALLETLVFWAMHRHFVSGADPDQPSLGPDEATVKREIVALLVNGVLP